MSRVISISVIMLLVAVPLAAPLLAHIPCCPTSMAPVLRPASMPCCQVTTLPHSSPVVKSLAPEMAVPAPAGLHADTSTAIYAEAVPPAPAARQAVFLSTPIRI